MIKQLATALSIFAVLVSAPTMVAQEKAQPKKAPAKATKPPATAEEQNVKEYIELLRKDVRSEKAKLMGAVMQLDTDDAAKFWPIYKDYQAELDKVNDLRVANIKEYARTYTQLTDDKADELIRNAMEYQKQRAELLAKYYDRMKQELGAITAARFVQVEHQLLLLIDLQIASSLPVAGS
jgi:hypothetical protein